MLSVIPIILILIRKRWLSIVCVFMLRGHIACMYVVITRRLLDIIWVKRIGFQGAKPSVIRAKHNIPEGGETQKNPTGGKSISHVRRLIVYLFFVILGPKTECFYGDMAERNHVNTQFGPQPAFFNSRRNRLHVSYDVQAQCFDPKMDELQSGRYCVHNFHIMALVRRGRFH